MGSWACQVQFSCGAQHTKSINSIDVTVAIHITLDAGRERKWWRRGRDADTAGE